MGWRDETAAGGGDLVMIKAKRVVGEMRDEEREVKVRKGERTHSKDCL